MNETALKERIKTISKEKGVTVNEVWKQLLLERFLARLSQSKHHDKFIFKGGLLLAQYITIGRETVDADFLITKMKNEGNNIKKSIQEISKIDLGDGFTFTYAEIEELAQPHMEYTGFRVTLNANFGKITDRVHLDIGFGDAVKPVEEKFHPYEYKGKPIFEGEISLLVYPVEAIFAEKLETVISKGTTNSRMKDYHDLILMVREPNLLNINKLKKSISATFKNRKTELLFPIEFDKIGLSSLQRLWSNHLKNLGIFKEKLDLPEQIIDLLKELNAWLKKNIDLK